jgi:hypothetical protein
MLNDTEVGRPHPPPEEPDIIFRTVTYLPDSKVLYPGGLLPIRALRSRVLCYDVYSSTKWVSRALTTHELGRCFNLSDAQLTGFPKKLVTNGLLRELTFATSTPARLTSAVIGLASSRQ